MGYLFKSVSFKTLYLNQLKKIFCMKSFLNLFFAISLLFISCKNELKPQDSSVSSKVVPFTTVANQQQNHNKLSSEPIQNQNTVNQSTAVSTPVAVAKGMNPAHGQPNHLCDIAVGAPLNSPVDRGKNNTISTQTAPQQNSALPATKASPSPAVPPITPERINPPHGQEKHRCDIAVGAPLPKE